MSIFFIAIALIMTSITQIFQRKCMSLIEKRLTRNDKMLFDLYSELHHDITKLKNDSEYLTHSLKALETWKKEKYGPWDVSPEEIEKMKHTVVYQAKIQRVEDLSRLP